LSGVACPPQMRWEKHVAAIAFFLVTAIVMTWPLAPNASLAMAHPGDPAITSWILDWGWYALTHQPARLFHANIFHPLPWTFALSENMLGVVVMLFPLFAANVPPLLLHNIAILLAFATAGYGATLLGRHVTGSLAAGIAGGVFFAYVPWRFTHLTHLQHLWTVWLPLLVLSLLRLHEKPTGKRAAIVTLCFVMNGLTNLHWLAFGSTAAALCVLVLAANRKFVAYAAIAIAIGSLLLAPLLYPYWRAGQLYAMRGDAGETLHYSATPSSWLIPSLHNRTWGRTNDGSIDPERWAFPGLIAPLLAAIGVFAYRRTRPGVAIAIALFALGFLGSLGLNTLFGRFLFDYVPLFRGIRVPARWAMIAYLGIAILASVGAMTLARRRWVHGLVIALLLLELRAAPIRWYLSTGATPPVYHWLAQQKVGNGVLELPPEQEHVYSYMFWSHLHHQPLINGVSGWKPPHYAALEEKWRTMPLPGSLVIAHDDEAWQKNGFVRVGAFGSDVVYATPAQAATLTPIPPLPPPAIAGTLEHPVHWEQLTGPLEIHGTASPNATLVILYFDNRRIQYSADPRNGRWSRTFPERPQNVRADTDLQVEILDAQGHRVRLPQAWLRWRRPGEKLHEGQLAQTADLGPYRTHSERRHPAGRSAGF
jgi:hypothetical protein